MENNKSKLLVYLKSWYNTLDTIKALFKSQMCLNYTRCVDKLCCKSHTLEERSLEHFVSTHGVGVKHEIQDDGSYLFNFKYLVTKVKWNPVSLECRGTIARATIKKEVVF